MSTAPDPMDPANVPATWREMAWRVISSKLFLTLATNACTLVITFLAMRLGVPSPAVVPPVEPPPQVIQSGATGWVDDQDSVNAAVRLIAAKQGMPAEFGQVAKGLMGQDDDKSVFFWQAERQVLGRVLPSWNQNPAGTCVSFGWGRACQDLILLRIVSGEREQWPGHEVATEPIYGGSRVEIGKGRIRGDGSVGAWAAQWVQQYGLLFRQKYADGKYDLSTYSVSLSRQWGKAGVPDDLEPLSREHPVETVARLATGAELWAALGSGYPVAVCSDVGFEGNPPSDGIWEPRGTWGHCMEFRGRFIHPTKGKCVVVQNSWGDYFGRRLIVATQDAGDVELPEGCFAIRLNVADRMVREGDTFAISSLKGFPKRKPRDWITLREPVKGRWLEFPFAMVP